MAGKVMTAVIDIAGSLNPSVKKSIDKAQKQIGALNVGIAAAGGALLAASGVAGKYLLDLGDAFDGAQDSIRIGTGATGAALDALMGDFDSVLKALPTSSESAALAVSDLNTKLGLQGKALQDVSKSAIYLSENLGAGELSAVIDTSSKAIQNWNISQDQMTAKMDYAFKVSQATGIGYNDLMGSMQKYGTTFRALGYDFETSAALVGQMTKAGVNVDEAMAAMKKSLSAMTKEGKNASEGFQQYYEQIYNATDATKAAQIASELFGTKAGPEMSAAIRDGRLEAGAFAAQLGANTETIAGLANETFDYKEKLQMMKNTMDVALRPVASTVFSSIGDTMPYVSKMFDKLQPVIAALGVVLPAAIKMTTGAIGFLGDNFVWMAPVIGTATAAVLGYKAIMAVSTISSQLHAIAVGENIAAENMHKGTLIITTGLKIKDRIVTIASTAAMKAQAIAMKAGAAAQWIMNAAMSANPIGLVIAGIAALVAGGVLLYKNWDKISAKTKELWGKFSGFLDKLGPLGAALKGFGTGWLKSMAAVVGNVKGVFTGMVNFVKNVFTGNWKGAWDAMKSIVVNAFQGLTGIIKAPLNAVIGMVNGAISKINGVGFTIPNWVPIIGGQAFKVDVPQIPMFATGGVATGPSIVGEGGYDEYVISTDPRYRSRNVGLLEQASAALGFDKMIAGLESAPVRSQPGSAGPIQVTFAPVIHCASDDGKDVLAQIRAQFPDFVDMVVKALASEAEGSYVTA